MERHHNRSKSQLAKSLLHRVSSRHDGNKDEEAAEADGVPLSPAKSTASASESNLSLTSTRASRNRTQMSTTMSHNGTQDGLSRAPTGSGSVTDGAPSSAPDAVSLEQSVRLFRYFESLRAGDTAAISKALKEQDPSSPNRLQGTTLLHLAIQCADLPVIEYVLANSPADADGSVNAKDKDGNTPLHLASKLQRVPVVRMLLDQPGINDSIANKKGETALDLAPTPEIFQQLQLARSIFIDTSVQKIHELVARKGYAELKQLLSDSRVRNTLDLNGIELPTDKTTVETGGTLLHEGARKKDIQLIQLLLMNGADPFRRDKKGKLPQDCTKDEKTRHILKRSPAAEAAQRSIQERSILGAAASPSGVISSVENPLGGKESREMKGYLKKWTNYTGGWKLRWFVLEEGVLSYYKNQDDAGAACRGAISMKIAKLGMDPQDKLKFEIQGKNSVKYHLKANHQVEAKRWYWALNNAIQWTKDEDKEEQRRSDKASEAIKQAKADARADHDRKQSRDDTVSLHSSKQRSINLGIPSASGPSASRTSFDEDAGGSTYESSVADAPATRMTSRTSGGVDVYDEDEELGDDTSSHPEAPPAERDALNITAHSLRLQLDLLNHISTSLTQERKRNPSLSLSDPTASQAIAAYESAAGNLKTLIGDLLRISNDREAYWHYRLEKEANIRRMWEESMARVAKEQEELENRMGEVEDKRKRTKRALRDALENMQTSESPAETPKAEIVIPQVIRTDSSTMNNVPLTSPMRKKSILPELADISDSDSDMDEEFFDAVGAGEVQIVDLSSTVEKTIEMPASVENSREKKLALIKSSFAGYEDPVRKRLKMDADNRPKISLWGILKSMIGKDMTKMTLPVSFNEPTSLLQRVAEDMEYTDLLDLAAEFEDSTERMVYVAAFAASEYASTIGRVAKPFNPLLGETYEYARPDKNYRFFIEQVSHHPPIGAAYAESPKWDYYGESNVKSKFYGKSFDINPLGTWFLRLRPRTGGSELYTWKKVTSSVIGIISGSPTVDNYGTMEVKNWNTGEVCVLEFKPRGWKASSAYIVQGRVVDSDGKTRWSIGGRWNDKIYARLTPGYEDNVFDSSITRRGAEGSRVDSISSTQAFLVWEANSRPTGIPFNLTPFGLTLNAVPDRLKEHLAPTDTRLRPDQRAMEDGEYDFAATEKNRVEEKQRATRRRREQAGEHFIPRWFEKAKCEITGEEFWKFNGEYWKMRADVANGGEWKGLEDIF